MLRLMTETAAQHTTVTRAPFGSLPDGSAIEIFTLASPEVEVSLITYGARVVSLKTADREGNVGDIVLGHSSVDGYLGVRNFFFGVIAGRFANRIAEGKFSLDGKTYQLPLNNGPNSLHGGTRGFDRHLWEAEALENGVQFSLTSPDGDQGYPGTLMTKVRYTLSGSRLRIEYSATTDAPTIVNLTNHAYFNLAGEGSPTVLDHVLTLEADHFTSISEALIPTGELTPTPGTPFDFTEAHLVGERIEADHEQLRRAGGYDHNFVLRGESGVLRPAARLTLPSNGRVLEVSTTEPGVQFYSGNFLDGSAVGKTGVPYTRRSGLCLETQHFPDSPNQPHFPSTRLDPGETFSSATEWVFSTAK